MIGGIDAAVFLLPHSGLFVSVMYPTMNSKGISCFPKSQHGAVAGVILLVIQSMDSCWPPDLRRFYSLACCLTGCEIRRKQCWIDSTRVSTE